MLLNRGNLGNLPLSSAGLWAAAGTAKSPATLPPEGACDRPGEPGAEGAWESAERRTIPLDGWGFPVLVGRPLFGAPLS